MRDLSSSLTFFNKYMFIAFWCGLFGLGTITMFLSPSVDNPSKYLFLVAWIGGTAFLYLICGRIKKVQLDGNKLIVSNYIKKFEINLVEVTSVSGSILLSPELIWFKLRTPIEFGQTIIFMPKYRFFGGFTKHPLVNELKVKCNLKSYRDRDAHH